MAGRGRLTSPDQHLTSTWARQDAFPRAAVKFWRWLPEAAPTERAFLEAFYLWIG
jgi:hypothetical protein